MLDTLYIGMLVQPERIDPPDPRKPAYDIRADVWSLGITLVELATGVFPYKDCKCDFEVLSKVMQDDPPALPTDKNFSAEFQAFVKWWLVFWIKSCLLGFIFKYSCILLLWQTKSNRWVVSSSRLSPPLAYPPPTTSMGVTPYPKTLC